MAIVGLNFTKIQAEKLESTKGKVNISNNVVVKDVEKSNLSLGNQTQDGLKFTFVYTSKYEPNFGNIELNGNLIFLEEPGKIEETLTKWSKEKKLPNDVMRETLNAILGRCNIQALIISKEINLPPPVPLPKVKVE